MKFFSPAKLNLFFRVIGKRPDGYHEIASLYQAIDFGDTLTLTITSGEDQLTCSDPHLPCDSSNLVLRAVNLFRKKTGRSFGLHAHLDKHIPIQAGLGGGSSNAATTLWALREMTGVSLSDKELSSWGAELGSDVPFFFSEGTAYCTGRGEIVENLPSLPHLSGWIAKPLVGLSTPAVYQKVVPLALDTQPFFNDLEPAAFSLLPELADLKTKLFKIGFEQVSMTGSGTAFFCLGPVSSPALQNVKFIPFRALQRTNNWYAL